MDSLPVRTIYPLADGSFLLGGYFTNYNGVPRAALAKILEDGALDTTFTPDASFVPHVTEVWSISQQPDGKFIVAGINGSPTKAMIVRLNTDGSLDPTFVFAPRLAHFGMFAQARTDGLIAYLTDDNFGIGLLNPDGSRFLTPAAAFMPFGLFTRIRTSPDGNTFYCYNSGLFRFGGSFGLPDDVLFNGAGAGTTYDLDFQSDGRIVCGGPSTSNGLRRYLPNGVLDTTFKAKVPATDLEAIVAQPDDKLLIGGTFTAVNGVARRNLARLNADGSLDTNFVTAPGPNSSVYSIALVPGGKALIAGKFTSYDGLSRTGLARIFMDPPSAPSFVTQPASTNLQEGQSLRLSVAVGSALPIYYQWQKDAQPIDGATNSVLLVPHTTTGQSGAYSVIINAPGGPVTSASADVKVASSASVIGSLKQDFANGKGASRTVSAYLPIADGKSLIAGDFSAFDAEYRPALARLNRDGSLDTALNLNLPSYANCTSLAKAIDGKILAGFAFGNISDPLLLRLNADGSFDSSVFGGSSSGIYAILPLADGKIIVGGGFLNLEGTSRVRLARLNSDCSVDSSFDANALQLTKVYALALQSDGKIIVGDEKRVLRVTATGAAEADLSLTTGIQQGARAVALQPDGKILVGGRFTAINGIARTNLARLNSDMTVDASFTAAAGVQGAGSTAVLAIAFQPDDKILVGGTFSDLGGAACTNIGRLLLDGSPDTSFRPIVGFRAPSIRAAVNSISIDDDSTITISGSFSAINEVTRNSLARIFWASPPLRVAYAPTVSAGQLTGLTISFPSDSSSDFVLQFSDTLPPTWQDLIPVPSGSNSIDQPLTGSQRFFRIQQKTR